MANYEEEEYIDARLLKDLKRSATKRRSLSGRKRAAPPPAVRFDVPELQEQEEVARDNCLVTRPIINVALSSIQEDADLLETLGLPVDESVRARKQRVWKQSLGAPSVSERRAVPVTRTKFGNSASLDLIFVQMDKSGRAAKPRVCDSEAIDSQRRWFLSTDRQELPSEKFDWSSLEEDPEDTLKRVGTATVVPLDKLVVAHFLANPNMVRELTRAPSLVGEDGAELFRFLLPRRKGNVEVNPPGSRFHPMTFEYEASEGPLAVRARFRTPKSHYVFSGFLNQPPRNVVQLSTTGEDVRASLWVIEGRVTALEVGQRKPEAKLQALLTLVVSRSPVSEAPLRGSSSGSSITSTMDQTLTIHRLDVIVPSIIP